MKIDPNNFEMTAKTMFGLEDVLVEELKSIGAWDIEKMNRAVRFRGNNEVMYRANLFLRTALRIYKPIHKFRVRDEKELYKRTKDVKWVQYLNQHNTFAINSTVNSEHFNHSNFVALKTKDAIVDQIRNKIGERPNVDLENPDLRIHIHISQEDGTISLDSSGHSLNKRGYRIEQNLAPINEVLAAGMIMISGWNGDSDFVDPMCGSGTILMEAATIAHNIAPGILRNDYGFMKWNDFDKDLWEKLRKEAKDQERGFHHKIRGFDASGRAISIAKANIKNAGLGWKILLKARDFENLTPESIESEKGVAVINPPYGARMDRLDVKKLYKMIGDSLKQNFAGYDVWIISSNRTAMKHIGLKTSERRTLFNASLECCYWKYEMYKGTKKIHKIQDQEENDK